MGPLSEDTTISMASSEANGPRRVQLWCDRSWLDLKRRKSAGPDDAGWKVEGSNPVSLEI